MKTIKLIILALATIVVSSNVWADEYVETALSDIKSSDIVVIVRTSGTTYAMSNGNGTSSAPTAVAVTVTNGKITDPADNLKWNISNSSGTFTVYVNGTTESWLYCTATNNGVRVGTNENKTFTIDGGYLKHIGTSRYVGVYNNADWRCYTSNTTDNIKDQTFAFYVKKSTTCTIDLDQPNVTATPGNNQATLTWQEVTNATGYKVSWNGGADENPTDTRTFTKTGLTNGTLYTWKVKAIGDATYCDSETSGNVTPVAPPATATVTWIVDGTTYHTTSNVTIGSTISTPDNPAAPASCGDAIFKGWTANQDYFHETAAPSDLFNGTSPTINGNITFYAIFADRQ